MSGKMITAVLGVPISKDKKFLMTKRHAPGNPLWHNKWQFAGGGLNHGETVEEGLLREMWEELHVKAQIIYPHPIVKTRILTKKNTDEAGEATIVLMLYLVDIGDQKPDLSHDPDWETNDWGWFSYEEASKLDSLPMTMDFLDDASQLLDKHEIIT
jgi:8-oxo-dGTP pyrophosphatase MutT (NUDIX family)